MLLQNTERGLFCSAGDFYIDPWKPVDFAVVTHAHSDHARWGSKHYLVSKIGEEIFRARLGPQANLQTLSFSESIARNGVKLSLHPAGHILGSAQIRVEFQGEVWVVSGDYKIESDNTCDAFEPIRCHTFVTESTFGLPIYKWSPQKEIFAEINEWWRDNQQKERTSVLFGYSLGKTQRLLAGLEGDIGPIFLHGAVANFIPAYQRAGVRFPAISVTKPENVRATRGKAMVIAPPSADNTPWLRKFGECSTAFASGWMQVRGTRRRRALDRGFALSDHVDWPGLMDTIKATGAEKIWATHGYTAPVVRWLRENGWDADAIKTEYEGESETEGEDLPETTEQNRED
ncbi:MAG: exonuclease of the beta-lactamase fold involved in processing-like protein [Verrucomicrobiales bacterium]|nr:exonuclease of the beta-lactamase fold involved in processing-like protein [Verrucomicrobiales bacterium]